MAVLLTLGPLEPLSHGISGRFNRSPIWDGPRSQLDLGAPDQEFRRLETGSIEIGFLLLTHIESCDLRPIKGDGADQIRLPRWNSYSRVPIRKTGKGTPCKRCITVVTPCELGCAATDSRSARSRRPIVDTVGSTGWA
jgi:hypothetical protein